MARPQWIPAGGTGGKAVADDVARIDARLRLVDEAITTAIARGIAHLDRRGRTARRPLRHAARPASGQLRLVLVRRASRPTCASRPPPRCGLALRRPVRVLARLRLVPALRRARAIARRAVRGARWSSRRRPRWRTSRRCRSSSARTTPWSATRWSTPASRRCCRRWRPRAPTCRFVRHNRMDRLDQLVAAPWRATHRGLVPRRRRLQHARRPSRRWPRSASWLAA